MDYTISGISIHWGFMPVKLTFSYGVTERFHFLIFRVRAGDQEGIGEVLVPPNSFLDKLSARLIGCDARQLDTLVTPLPEDDHDRILCEAVSIALHDLVGKLSGLPLRTLLGGSNKDRVALMPCIFPNNVDEARERAAFFLAQGHRYLKVKLSGDLREDLGRVNAVRSVSPAGVILQGDANEGYFTLAEATEAVKTLGDAGLDVFEDPLKGDVDDYARLRKANGARIMVDALARRTDNLVRVLRADAADIVGIHPDQPGSLTRVMEHASLARSFGADVVIGGTGYTGIGTAAYQQLTAVVTPDGPCGELGGYVDHFMPKCMAEKPLPVEDGDVLLPDSPGLGIELNMEVLAELEEGSKSWGVME